MSEHVRIPFPLLGVHVDAPHGDQPPGTTSDALNVRGVDPDTGRSVGASRSGTTRYLGDPLELDEPIARLAVVARSRPLLNHTQLDELDNGTTDPPQIAPAWAVRTPRGGPARAIAIDSQGNVYSLDGAANLVKHNSDGEQVLQKSLPANALDIVARRVAIGAEDAVYVGGSSVDGKAGKIWRFVPDSEDAEKERLSLFWTLTLDKGVSDLLVDGDALYVYLHGEDNPAAELAAYFALSTTQPLLGWRRPIPDPVNDMALAPDGGLLIAVQENPRRGAGLPVPNRTSVVTRPWPYGPMWSPHELHQARQRLYGWWDAKTLPAQTALDDGDEVLAWPSRVAFDTTAGAGLGNYPSVHDATERTFATETTSGQAQFRHGPTFRVKGAGGVPCVDFNADRRTVTDLDTDPRGEALFTQSNTNTTAKSSATDSLPGMRSMFPGWANANYCLVMAVRVRRRSQVGVLLSQLGGPPSSNANTSYGLLVNGEQLSGGPSIANRAVSEGRVSSDVGSRNDADYNATADFSYNRVSSGDGPQTGAGDLADGDSEADSIGAVISLNISDVPGGSVLRVNGVQLDNFGMGDTRSSNTAAGTAPTTSTAYALLGSMSPRNARVQRNAADTTDTAVYGRVAAYGSFDGEVLEMIVVLGSTTTTPHDTPVSAPVFGQGQAVGSEAPALVRIHPGQASELELLEGYIAHANGLAHVLANGGNQFHGVAGIEFAHVNHPFGGTGEFPVSAHYPISAEAEQDLWTADGKLSKITPASGAAEWTLRAAGTGDAAAGDDVSAVGSIGPHRPQPPVPSVEWASRADETDIVARKVIDLGYTYDIEARAKGLIHVDAIPAEGTTLIVDDGRGAQTFTFTSTPALPTDIDIGLIADNRLGHITMAGRIATALSAPANGFAIFIPGGATVVVLGDQPGSSGNNPMGGTAGVSGALVLDGLRDGRDGAGAWVHTEADPNDHPIGGDSRIVADQDKDYHILWRTTNNDARVRKHLGADGTVAYTYDFSGAVVAHALAARFRPFDFNPDTVRGPELLIVGHDDGGTPSDPTLTALRLVAEEIDASSTSPRAITSLAVVNGSIYTFTALGASLATDGQDALDAGSAFIDSAALFGEVFFADGRGYAVYNAKSGTVSRFTSKTGGELPKGARLIAAWNGRLVLARTKADGHAFHFSAQGDPYDWNLFPAVVTPTQAVSAPASTLGGCPDIINGLAPYSDDLLLLLCDSSIWRLTGDPMIGGHLDRVSDIVGGAFGRAHCKDPEGRFYFFGSKGGVYVLAGADGPQSLTQRRIERRLNAIDLSECRVELIWNYQDEGLHVFVFGLGAPSALREHWFWDRKNNAWWPDVFAGPQAQPSAVCVLDGDGPDDRVLLLGGEDGRIRAWDRRALDDDGVATASHVKIGPLAPAETPYDVSFSRLAVTLSGRRQGCMAELLVGDTAADGGRVVSRFALSPGRNHTRPERATGGYAWLRLYNVLAGSGWAYEAATMDVRAAGRRQVRR